MQACIYGGDGQAVLRVFSTHDGWKIHHGWFINLYLCWKRYFKISYSFSRGYRSITRFVKRRIWKIFYFKKGVFFVKLLGITFFRLFIKTVPPRYNITHLSTSQVQNTFQLHFLLKTLTPFQSCMALQLSMTADAAILIVLSLQRGALYPQQTALPPGITPGLLDDNTWMSVGWSRSFTM